MKQYQYRFDTNEATVSVERGGTASELFEIGGGFWAVDITFPRPLKYGQTASMQYVTTFRYSKPPPPELRRGTHGRIESLEVYLRFHPGKLPRKIWWGVWEDYRADTDTDTGPVEREATVLDPECSVHRCLTFVERTVVGFFWEW